MISRWRRVVVVVDPPAPPHLCEQLPFSPLSLGPARTTSRRVVAVEGMKYDWVSEYYCCCRSHHGAVVRMLVGVVVPERRQMSIDMDDTCWMNDDEAYDS